MFFSEWNLFYDLCRQCQYIGKEEQWFYLKISPRCWSRQSNFLIRYGKRQINSLRQPWFHASVSRRFLWGSRACVLNKNLVLSAHRCKPVSRVRWTLFSLLQCFTPSQVFSLDPFCSPVRWEGQNYPISQISTLFRGDCLFQDHLANMQKKHD